VRYHHESIAIVCSDRETAIVGATDVGGLTMPWAFSLLEVQASLLSAASSGTFTVDVNSGGVSLLSTKCTIDATEETSQTAAAPSVLTGGNKMIAIAKGAVVTIDVDDDAAGDALGLIVYLVGLRHI
jgi:hypothetical protein